MDSILEHQLKLLQNHGTHLLLRGVLHGIEKEGLRVDASGTLSLSPHPKQLGAPLTNSSITTDFSESLLELITPVFTNPAAALNFLKTVHQFTYSSMGEEFIWAASMPCRIPDPSLIPIAQYGESNMGQMKHVYRVGLAHRYGKMMQSIAGIHYNFSIPDEFWRAYQELEKNQETFESFRSSSYFRMIRNFRRHSWLLLYLFGASPAVSRSFLQEKRHNLQTLYTDTLYLPYATSLRMSGLGYSTTAQASLNICFNHLKTYIQSLTKAIHTPYPLYEEIGVKVDGRYRQLSTTILQIENEYYSDVRPKRVPRGEETPLQALKKRGVEYIEVRNTDINPLLPVGIDLHQAIFLDTFLISCLLMGDAFMTSGECKRINENLRNVTTRGREPGLDLLCLNGTIKLKEAGSQLIRQFELTAELLDQLHNTSMYSQAVKIQSEKLHTSSLTPSAQVFDALRTSGLEYTQWTLNMSKEHKETLQTSAQDDEVLKSLALQSKASVAELQEIEASDNMDFDEFLHLYRTGEPNNPPVSG
ncbi:MAG: glutamate--cysteine ligase [Desulforhopalus sp.]